MPVVFHYNHQGAQRRAGCVKSILKDAAALLKKDIDASIIFIGDSLMRRLNRGYRKKDKTTNVLSFDNGDIFISVPEAKREAKKYGLTIEYEFARLALHGFLHLLGYDHEKNKDAIKMEKIEKKLLDKYA